VNQEVSKVQIMRAEISYLFDLAVWEFDVHVVSTVAKSLLKAHSAMSWNEIEHRVLKLLEGAVLPVQLAYKLSGDTRKMTYLKGDSDWAEALRCLDARARVVRKNAVSMEVRNLVSL
jgi:hypothetical protein